MRRARAPAAALCRWAQRAARVDAPPAQQQQHAARSPARAGAAAGASCAVPAAALPPGWRARRGARAQHTASTAAGQSLADGGIDNAFRVWPNGGGAVHAYAAVDASAVVELTAVVFPGARVGAGCRVGAGSVVGPGCVLGDGCVLHYGVSVSHARLGARCTLHHGVRLGGDGFGFAHDPATGAVAKKPQVRAVVLGDDVELGANTCVDRGSWRDTHIGDGTKVDNLVQIGHNARVGARVLLCGHVALGGSCELGDGVIMGGKSAVRDHVTVAAGARIAAKAGVTRNITRAGDYAGFPAQPAAEWRRREAALRRMLR